MIALILGWITCTAGVVIVERWMTRTDGSPIFAGKSDFPGEAILMYAILLFASPVVVVWAITICASTLYRGIIPILIKPWSLSRAIRFPENWSLLVKREDKADG